MSVPVPRLLLSVLIAAQLAACSSGMPVAAPTAPVAEPPMAETRADAAVVSRGCRWRRRPWHRRLHPPGRWRRARWHAR